MCEEPLLATVRNVCGVMTEKYDCNGTENNEYTTCGEIKRKKTHRA
jgi:hypothetical protein